MEKEGVQSSPLVTTGQDLGLKKLPRQETETRGTEGEAEKETDMMLLTELEISALNKSQRIDELPEKTRDETVQQRKAREAKELDKEINEYADLAEHAMTQEMIDNDDLLEEHEEEIEDPPETEPHVREEDMEDERIEALSQMSPEPQISKQKSVSKMLSQKESRVDEVRGLNQDSTKPKSTQRITSQTAPVGTRRGIRNQELKGAAASKKLSSRGRLSPKAKQLKPPREQLIPPHTSIPSLWNCQTDASWINKDEKAGLGFVFMHAGTPMLYGARELPRVTSSLHAEAEGLIWAMQKILKTRNRSVQFELDCEQLVKLIQSEEDWPSMAAEIDEIKALSLAFLDISIIHIPRSSNVCADSLAKGGRSRGINPQHVDSSAPYWLASYAGQNRAT
ncbi:hypothetical protein IGI04_032188 [Brassica rapa subsp. trilocularis]|uniref:RNase H type-1 domain-containing protein n=1 Tax=Brassica rapa subsp. trilocularis TaxID=1813537 RepID=A0ABQ7LVR6_BRACM|nr:hypothetical protein IGI04_032188 [Brassica rapa subsp. trilocularis]